jgi:signal recognition particle receptor subunit beta
VAIVNLTTREIAIKLVYYGPGLGGKTSSMQYIHRALRPDSRGQLVSLATGVDRTLYFDFLPVKIPKLAGFAMRVQLYTVPGQVHYNSTRKLVLTGVDGVVFVADSQRPRMGANVESLENLVDNLAEQGLSWRTLPLVLMLNKRDAPDALPAVELEARLNSAGVPVFESVATRGVGVFDALKSITSLVITELRKKGALPEEPQRAEGSGPLGEVADAVARLAPGTDPRASGPHRVPVAPSRDLSDLVAPGKLRDALAAVEGEIDRGDWAAAIRIAAASYGELAGRVAGALAQHPEEAPALAALLAGVPAARFLRFRELIGRAEHEGGVSSTDALLALFFLTDLALRTDGA